MVHWSPAPAFAVFAHFLPGAVGQFLIPHSRPAIIALHTTEAGLDRTGPEVLLHWNNSWRNHCEASILRPIETIITVTIDCRDAIQAQTFNGPFAATIDLVVIRAAVVDDIVLIRDVRNVRRLVNDRDVFRAINNHLAQ